MKFLTTKAKDWYVTIPVTDVAYDDGIVTAFNNGSFVGVFDVGAVDAIYVTEKKDERQ